jgi:hypothetical protein
MAEAVADAAREAGRGREQEQPLAGRPSYGWAGHPMAGQAILWWMRRGKQRRGREQPLDSQGALSRAGPATASSAGRPAGLIRRPAGREPPLSEGRESSRGWRRWQEVADSEMV